MKTVLYYTSNREKPEFEQKITDTLLENCGDLPIISVSQKPMDLGNNICVGDVGHSYLNLYRQQLVGAREADTEYLVFAEADFLYPPEYFEFEPDGENCYFYGDVWILFGYRVKEFRRKSMSHGAQIVKRDYLIDRLESGLEGMPEWYDGHPTQWKSTKQRKKVTLPKCEMYVGEIPCVSIKTGDGMNKWTNIEKVSESELPYWGSADELRKKYGI